MLLNPRYGRLGLFAVPYYWVFELAAPVIELLGIVLELGQAHPLLGVLERFLGG